MSINKQILLTCIALLCAVALFEYTNIIALVSVMAVAWSMGMYKMLIGDHFLSHTIMTMLLSWLITLIVAKIVSSLVRNIHDEPAIQQLQTE